MAATMANKKADPMGVLPARLSPKETAQRDQAVRAAREGLPELEMHADELDKTIDQKWSLDENEYTQASNPMLDCVNRYKAEHNGAVGMSFKFFTPAIAAETGTENYEKCLDKDGNPYTVGLDWMGMIPTRIAAARKKKALDDSQDMVTESESRFGNGVERLKAEAAKHGLVVTTVGGVQIGGEL